jgi:hypothetical protein
LKSRKKNPRYSSKAAKWIFCGVNDRFGSFGSRFVYHFHAKAQYVMVMGKHFKWNFRSDLGHLPNQREELLKMINGIPVKTTDILKKSGRF